MRPTLRQMRYVVTAHELGNFGLAASTLNVSQPSLSNQIAAVENELEVTLFERGRRGAAATAKGLEFVSRAREILSAVEDLRNTMQTQLPFGGRLRLGALPSIGPYLLPQVMKELHKQEPSLRVLVREENTLSLDEGIRNGRFDAIISTPEDHPNTYQIPLFREPLWVAVARDDPIARGRQCTSDDLQGRRLLALDSGHRLARIVHGIAGMSGGIVSDEYEGTSLDSIVLMAATGAGVGVLPDLFARRQAIHRTEVTVRPLTVPDADRVISLMLPVRRTADTVAMLLSIMRQSARDLELDVLGQDMTT